MGDPIEHVEAAIAEATKTRDAIKRSRQRQVSTVDETSRLKAVAFAWLRTHRAIIQSVDGLVLSHVDAIYQRILEATGRKSARTTYVAALKEAKDALIELRTQTTMLVARASASTKSGPELPPTFAALAADPAMQAILSRRWNEVQQCIAGGAHLAATVMMGGLMETLLLARINALSNKAPVYTAKNAARDKAGKTLPLQDWKLTNMVEVAHELSWISKSAKDLGHVLRDFRNYIHPHKEHAEGVSLSSEDSAVFWDVCKSITRQVLASI
ncbi:MAG: hypothetical protein AB7O24_00610 [Kofleriaceae bacterium]